VGEPVEGEQHRGPEVGRQIETDAGQAVVLSRGEGPHSIEVSGPKELEQPLVGPLGCRFGVCSRRLSVLLPARASQSQACPALRNFPSLPVFPNLAWLDHVVMCASCGATIEFESWRKPSRVAVGDGR
jgi:hypothetical protein